MEIWRRFFLSAMILVPTMALAQSQQPGPQAAFSIAISAPQTVVKSGSDVTVNIALTNASGDKINVGQDVSRKGEFHYQFDIRDGKRNHATKTKYFRSLRGDEVGRGAVIMRGTIIRTLQPGQTLLDEVNLTKLFDLNQPGKYTIQVERRDEDSKIVVKSNVIEVTVTE